ncbi:GTPase RsgA [Spiroplasma endosymbiont of Aspidapion aeneum]|uniref:GTPase RsgA n=1 Tax=Spiroplasma endosymbiont of Aspidapion aeneum TaxID=3066276 RepID=UPI00313A7D45
MKYCKGCGILLQNINTNEKGYIVDLINQDYCLRCFKLKNYNQLVDIEFDLNSVYKKIESVIADKATKNRYFYVIDVIDVKGSRLPSIENLLKNEDVIFCINKIDIFPNVIDNDKIYDYVINQLEDTPIINKNIILLSSKQLNTIDNLIKIINSKECDNYFIGVSNTGKSSLLNSCLKQQNKSQDIITSYHTNTTLDIININLGLNNKVYDTPGLQISKSILNAIDKKNWKHFAYNDELKQFTYQLKINNSIICEKIMWLELLESNREVISFHFWTNKHNILHRTNSKNVQKYLDNNDEKLIKTISSKFIKKVFYFKDNNDINIVVSGIGWISFKTHVGLKIAINTPYLEDNEVYIYKTNNN